MTVIIAPDKFKGSLNSFEVCRAIAAGLAAADLECSVQSFPLADGGDGFAQVMQHYHQTQTIHCTTVDALGRTINSSYQWSPGSKTAIIELAAASGIALLQPHELNPLITNTYGTGLLVLDALQRGADKIVLGIGGSATNDGGAGILAALGFTFFDKQQCPIPRPAGGNLEQVQSIVPPSNLPMVDWLVCCDVSNPFCGPGGAAWVYAPQKGANAQQVQLLDAGLQHFAGVLQSNSGINVLQVAGAGAAGGVAGGLHAALGARLQPGIDMVIEASGLDKVLAQGAALVITGEGKFDSQSLQGKVVGRVAALAAAHQVPCVVFCGRVALTQPAITAAGVHHAYTIAPANASLHQSMGNAANFLSLKVQQVAGELQRLRQHGIG